MKILYIVKTNQGATWAFDLACQLKSLGHRLVIMLPFADHGSALKYREYGMEVIGFDAALPVKAPWKLLPRILKFRKLLAEIQPDLVHVHFVTNAFFVRLAMFSLSVPRLFQIPGPLHLESVFFRWLDIHLAGERDFWAPSCQRSGIYLKDAGADPEHIFLNYYGGYGGAACDKYADASGILHRELRLPENIRLAGMVSYIYPPKRYLGQRRGLKGHEDFIDAIGIVQQTHPELYGVIIGDIFCGGEYYKKQLREYAAKVGRGKIIFTGFRSDLAAVYRELDVAVHPSHSENLGAAAESLAAGVPTVSTDVGGFPDIVCHGETGLTVPAKNPEALAQAIIQTIENYPQAVKMAEKGREKVRRLLDIEETARETSRIYNVIHERCK